MMWQSCWISAKARADHKRLSDHVVSELAKWNSKQTRAVITSLAQDFMRKGMQQNTALVAAYTLCIHYNKRPC